MSRGDRVRFSFESTPRREPPARDRLSPFILGALALHALVFLLPEDRVARVTNSLVTELWLAPNVAETLPERLVPVAPEASESTPAVPPRPLEGSANRPSSAARGESNADASVQDSLEAPGDEAATAITSGEGDSGDILATGFGEGVDGNGGFESGTRSGRGFSRAQTLAARDLSREPIAPNLLALVERNFPQIARMYRVEGDVTVSAMLDANGTPSDVRVEQVDPEGRGFGEACARTVLQGPAWQPRLNRDGRPVGAAITYTCHFRQAEVASTAATKDGRTWNRSAE